MREPVVDCVCVEGILAVSLRVWCSLLSTIASCPGLSQNSHDPVWLPLTAWGYMNSEPQCITSPYQHMTSACNSPAMHGELLYHNYYHKSNEQPSSMYILHVSHASFGPKWYTFLAHFVANCLAHLHIHLWNLLFIEFMTRYTIPNGPRI